MAVEMLSISRSTVDCNSTTVLVHPWRSSSGTFVVEMLYYCNQLCYVKCSTSLLTFKAVANRLHHIICVYMQGLRNNTWKHCCLWLSFVEVKRPVVNPYLTDFYLFPFAIHLAPLPDFCLRHISILLIIECEWPLLNRRCGSTLLRTWAISMQR